MKPADDELFAHIKESLIEHEEEYVPGAWERFDQQGGKKTGWLWFAGLGSAAAVILIGVTLFFATNKGTDNLPQQQAKVNSDKENTSTGLDTISRTVLSHDIVENLNTKVVENKNIVKQRTNNNTVNNSLIVSTGSPIQIVASNTNFAIPQDQNKPGNQNKLIAAKTDSGTIAKVPVKEKPPVNENKPRSFQDFLDAEVKANGTLAAAKSTSKKADKWEMGLMVAPSIGNGKKLNMGYGVSMDYALSDKISISSGISYNEMGATKSMVNVNTGVQSDPSNAGVQSNPSNMVVVSDTKSLESVDANLVGIDIPLGIKYALTKKFYTNIGVSAFVILNQKQNNNYRQGYVEYAAADPANASGLNAVFQTKMVSEAVPEAEIKDDKYLGFYNISFGFQQKISGSKAFSVEPFMKLPIKEFTKENLHLIGTGIRLKFEF